MLKRVLAIMTLALIGAGVLYAQNSQGGVFVPGNAYIVSGTWTWRTQASPLIFEGTTDDAFETRFTFTNPTADRTVTFPDQSLTLPNLGAAGALLGTTLTTNTVDAANSVWGASNALVFEGATADGNELTVSPADVGADRTVTIPDAGAAAALMVSLLTTNAPEVANSLWFATGSAIVFEGATADANEATLTFADPAADGTLTLTLAGQTNGEQLQTNGTGTLTWEAAGSRREFKHVEGRMDPADGLRALLAAPVYRFHYRKPGANEHITTTGDFRTQYVGVMADEAPWAMHHNDRILNPVNTFGYTVLAIQALEARVRELEAALASRGN